MKTSKAISTVSYNSEEYLITTLQELEREGLIEYWFFVSHLSEDEGEKEHIHLYLQPSKLIQTTDLNSYFIEDTHDGHGLSCKILPFHPSKEGDALLYFLHDEEYLLSKGMARLYHYQLNDVRSNSIEQIKRTYRQVKRGEMAGFTTRIKNAIYSGYNLSEFIASGQVNPNQIAGVSVMWNCIKDVLFKEEE